MHRVTFKIEKQPPTALNGSSDNLELFHGIGNTLGFNITGGSDFSMPITIFHVKEGSRADNAGLKLGDSIVTINHVDTNDMTLQEANNVLEQSAQKDVKLGVIKFDEVDEANPDKKPSIHEILLKGSLSVELTIKAMQRQLLQISDRVPDDILLTLLKCFAQILSREPDESTASSGPFIRAFTKIRDDGVEKKVIEDEEEESPNANNDDNNECTFNYKVSNVVTQEVTYSMGDDANKSDGIDGDCVIYESGHDNHHEMPQLLDPDEEIKVETEQAVVDEKFEEISQEIEDMSGNVEDNLEAVAEDQQPVAEETEIAVEIATEEEQIDKTATDDSEQPQIDEIVEQEVEEEEPKEEKPVIPMQTVTLDDIQREIQEMQMFLFNKGIAPEIMQKRHENHRKLKKIEDSFNVDFCVNLNKKGSHDKKSSSKSKAILTNYLNEHPHGRRSKGHKVKQATKEPIFDPSVPNTPEDFLKQKSVTEKINKKKQKIKHLDVSWQKLCDSQNKVYKHSNFSQYTETTRD